MPVDLQQLESAIRTAIPVIHLEIEDRSSGCGENYAIVLVSEVCKPHFSLIVSSYLK
jgi:stress-induced morphogen